MSDEELIKRIITAANYQERDIEPMTPAPYNPRRDLQPGEYEYERLKKSILDHGMLQPIIYNEQTGNVVGGNQRRKVLLDMGITKTVCAVINVPLAFEMQINLAMNRLGNMWDQPKLREVMVDLKNSGFDMSKTSFADFEIEKYTQNMGISVDSFFEDEDEEESGKEHHARQYKCPYCGEVFEK